MLRPVLASWWREPRPPDPPARVWRDWLLVGLLVPTAVLEGILRTDVVWRPFATITAVAIVPLLLWRRTQPLTVVVVAFGSFLVVSLVDLVAGHQEPVGLYSNVFVLLLCYSLFRWGSGRDMVLGLLVMLVTAAAALAADWTGVVEAVFALVFLLFPGVVAATVRYRQAARVRELEQMKTSEREQLARELHDTVAHHVSAIAVRAQAGRVVAHDDPVAALDALVVIEQEASRTLQELRTIVGLLRNSDHAELAPQRGVADIPALGRTDDRPTVRVSLRGDLTDLPAPVNAALYRMAQESLTNALQHARDATEVDVTVTGEPDCVRLVVRDDGVSAAGSWSTAGYGLVGMRERATLLGGSLDARPHPDGGWSVEAMVPRASGSR